MKILDIPRSGSYAGIVSSHNRAGQYVRNRRAPVQPIGTGRRAIARAAFTSAAAGFGGLTTAQQDAWSSFAAAHPVTDSLGQTITLTGQQMYVRVAVSQSNSGQSVSATPPADLTLPDLSTATFAAVLIGTGPTVDNFSGAAGQVVVTAFSAPLPPGRRFWKTFWQPFLPDGVGPANTPPITLPWATYAAQFGMPVAGQRIFVRLTPLSPDGWNGTPVVLSTLVT